MSDASRSDSTAIDLRRGTLQGSLFHLVRAILRALLWVTIRMRFSGVENVPRSGPLLVVSNHLHNADPVLIATAVPRPLHYMTKTELFRNPILGAILRFVGAFPIDRGKADRAAIRRAEAMLAQDMAVGMFPEGTRSVTRVMQRAHPGAGLLALRNDVPVLPIVIYGSERLPGNGAKSLRRGSHPNASPSGQRGIQILIGKPFTIPREEGGRRVTSAEATERMMLELAKLLPPGYQGTYAVPADATTGS